MTAEPKQCPSAELLDLLLAERLTGPEREPVEVHVEGCPDCQGRLHDMVPQPAAPKSDYGFDHEPPEEFMRRLMQITLPKAALLVSDVAVVRPSSTVDRFKGRRLGQYEILERLGSGNMGVVYKARHTELERIVALKVMPAGFDDELAIARFKNEARAAGRLEHSNIVGAHDAGQIDGTHFLVMTFVDGIDLARLLDRAGRLDVADACEVVRQAAAGLQHAFERGLVHRDIKPSNLMLTSDGILKVLDFGIARTLDLPAVERLTGTGMMLGTADYLAPEQWENPHAVDTRADVYGLGCTLYHLIAGRPPFYGPDYDSILKKMRAHLEAPPMPLARVPTAVGVIVERMLAKQPADRFANPGEVEAALRSFTAGTNLAALVDKANDAAPPTPFGDADTTQSVGTQPLRHRRSKPTDSTWRRYVMPFTAISLAVLLAASLVAHFAPRNRGARDENPYGHVDSPLAEVLAINVSHRGKDDVARGEVGETVQAVPADDGVRVAVKLSTPAYCYLIAFNPDGTEQLCYPEDPALPAVYFPEHKSAAAMMTAPVRTAELRFPSDRVFTPDVPGLQAFVLVVSPEPLPPYAHWRARVDRIPWEPALEQAQACWHFDGERLERLPRERGRTIGGAPPQFRALCDFFALRRELGSVRAIAFPVTKPEQPVDVPPERRQLAPDDAKRATSLYADFRQHFEAGRYSDAMPVIRTMLDLYREKLGEMHPAFATVRANLAATERIESLPKKAQDEQTEATKLKKQADELRGQARFNEAIAIAERVVAIRERLGGDCDLVAQALNDYGFACHRAGRYKKAEEILRRSLAVAEKVWGAEHPSTIAAVGNLAMPLNEQLRYADAAILARRVVRVRLRVHGENHADTALAYNNLASNLDRQGESGEAEKLYRQALKIFREVHRNDHPQTAIALNNLGYNLNNQGRYNEAENWYRQALDMTLAVFGPNHAETAQVYNNRGTNLADQAHSAEAESLYRKALAIYIRTPGEDHDLTLSTYNNLALCLANQGRHKDGEEMLRRIIAFRSTPQDQETRPMAIRLSNLASNLQAQHRYTEARELFDKVLAINRKLLTEEHEETAASYNSLASLISAQGKWAEAEPLLRKALPVIRRRLGDEHPFTALVVGNLGANLYNQGKFAEAEELNARALEIDRKVLGESHSQTAGAYKRLIETLWARGKYREAERLGPAAAASFEAARRRVSYSGLDRTAYAAENSPLSLLAAIAARNGKPDVAWRWLESNLARGLLDELAERPLTDDERRREQELLGRLRRLDDEIAVLLGASKVANAAREMADGLRREREQVQAEFAQLQADLAARLGVAAGDVYDLARIQAKLANDMALVAWVDRKGVEGALDPNGEHWACVVRRAGPPQWVKLMGSGKDGAWTPDDERLADDARRAFAERPKKPDAGWKVPADKLSAQRLKPLDRALGARDGLPVIGKLVILPSPALRGIPIEALTDRYVISYAPSGTMFASLREKSLRTEHPARKPNILAVGDPSLKPAGPPAPGRTADESAEYFGPLPGTRREVDAIARLFPEKTLLVDADANEHNLNALAASGQLARYRFLHFATHGAIDERSPLRSALILSPNPLPLKWLLGGSDRLTAQQIAHSWKLDADLVTLSACRSALGRYSGGEGYLGFSQALFRAGARSLVLSLWQVDDRATVLLMTRFYQNLLGARAGQESMPRAAALAEARSWLRGLSAADAERLAAELPATSRGTARDPRRTDGDATSPRPFDHPYYWSAFILIGDPN